MRKNDGCGQMACVGGSVTAFYKSLTKDDPGAATPGILASDEERGGSCLTKLVGYRMLAMQNICTHTAAQRRRTRLRPAGSSSMLGRATCGPVAQWLEQRTHNPSVPGSSPGGPTSLRSQRSESEGCRADLSRRRRSSPQRRRDAEVYCCPRPRPFHVENHPPRS